jgi:hypothetical protein
LLLAVTVCVLIDTSRAFVAIRWVIDSFEDGESNTQQARQQLLHVRFLKCSLVFQQITCPSWWSMTLTDDGSSLTLTDIPVGSGKWISAYRTLHMIPEFLLVLMGEFKR